MADVFVSYSRRDSEFVAQLAQGLTARGKDVWVDVDGIRDAEVFPDALRDAVQASDGFVFVISPASVSSRFCAEEVAHALRFNKRIVPLALRPVRDEEVPEGIRVRNWIPIDEQAGFDAGLDRLVTALDTDLQFAREHTALLLKASEWAGKGRDASLLLRGSELAAAERWLAAAAGREPEPAPLHAEYVLASRAAATRRLRGLVATSLAVAVVALALLVFALISRHSAIDARATARSRALAAQSINQQGAEPELAILLAMRAVQTRATPDALFALRGAIDASPLRMRLPPAAAQTCTPPIGGPGLAYAPGGTRLAETLCQGELRLFETRSGRLASSLRVPAATGAVAYSPGGRLLAVGTETGITLLDAGTHAVRAQLAAGAAVNSLAFSPDGSLIAATTQDRELTSRLVVWSVATGSARVLARGPFNPLYGVPALRRVLFTRDGRSLIVGGAPGVRVYALAGGRAPLTLPGTRVADDIALGDGGSELAVSVLAYDESQVSVTPLPVASSTTTPDTVALWRVRGWRPLGTLASFPIVEQTAIAFSPDGTRVAIGGADGKAGLWQARTRQPIVSFAGAKAAIDAIAFSPDGTRVATGVADGTAAVWHAGGFELRDLDTGDAITNGGVSRDRLVLTDALGARLWTYPGLRPLPWLRMLSPGAPPGSEGGALSTNGTLGWWHTAASIEIWNTRERRIVAKLPPGSESAIAFSHDSRRVAYFDPASPMQIVDLRTHHRTVLAGRRPPCPGGWRWAVFSPDDRFLAASTLCGQTLVWSAARARLVARLHDPVQIGLTDFSADDTHIALGRTDGTIEIWDVRDGSVRVLAGAPASIGTVAYSPDGRLLASTSLDGTARIWDPASGRVLRVFPHSYAALWAPDGKLLTVDAQGVIRFWNGCAECTNAPALLALARTRVTRALTPAERATFLNGS